MEPPGINHEPFHERQTRQNRHCEYQFLQILDFQEQQTTFAEQTAKGKAHQQQCGAFFPDPTFFAVVQLCWVRLVDCQEAIDRQKFQSQQGHCIEDQFLNYRKSPFELPPTEPIVVLAEI
jgi:hypothetical protein